MTRNGYHSVALPENLWQTANAIVEQDVLSYRSVEEFSIIAVREKITHLVKHAIIELPRVFIRPNPFKKRKRNGSNASPLQI